jgi:hypothetical protein
MPYSYSKYKEEYKQHMLSNFNTNIKILDAGAGSGAYWDLLSSNYKWIFALEIYTPYIQMFDLNSKYINVFEADIRTFDISIYDYIILGDIIEHLSIKDATELLERIHNSGQKCLVAVPYEFEQGEEYGNIHEIHKQPELTPNIMLERYPMLTLLFGDTHYGYYINY